MVNRIVVYQSRGQDVSQMKRVEKKRLEPGPLPFVFMNIATTADGKLAPASRKFIPFQSARDHEHLLELRATADAVMSGARTVDMAPVKMDAGGMKYCRQRLRHGFSKYNLRIVVSGAGTLDPKAEIFKHRFSPIIILTTERAPKSCLQELGKLADAVKVCGERKLDFDFAFRWLRREWGVKRLLCEGGGEINAALFEAGLVNEVHVTLCPVIIGGRTAPTMADGEGFAKLADAAELKMISQKRIGDEQFLVYRIVTG